MYASSDIAWNGHVNIYRLVSTDGKAWQLNPASAVLRHSENNWDSHSVETPAVVYYQNNYHLFYTGYDVPYDYTSKGKDGKTHTADDDISSKHFKIGHAISSDGINFSKLGIVTAPTSPYSEPNLDFNQFVVGEPAPVVIDNSLYLYFTAVGADVEVSTTWQVIGLTRFDGSKWDEPRVVLKPNKKLYPREEYIGYSTPNALVIDGSVHLFYDVVKDKPWTQSKIHHAFSKDGITNWVEDASAIMAKEDYRWTKAEIRSPSALLHHNLLYLYFAGHVLKPSINLSIGLEILPVE